MRRAALRLPFERPNPRPGWLGATALAAVGALILAAAFASQASAQTPDGDDGTPRAFEVTVTAEVLEANAPASVEALDVVRNASGQLAHGVVVTWNDSAA